MNPSYKLSYPTYLQIFLFILKTMLTAYAGQLLCDNFSNQIYNLHISSKTYTYEPVFCGFFVG